MGVPYYTIEMWLKGKVDFDFPDTAIASVLFDRQLWPGIQAAEVSERDRDLCLADLLMFAGNAAVTQQAEFMSDGGWQHQKAARNVYDRAALRAMAARLYRKWGDTAKAQEAEASGMTMKDLY